MCTGPKAFYTWADKVTFVRAIFESFRIKSGRILCIYNDTLFGHVY